MTVIAVRDGVMAADSRGTFGQQPYHCAKIYRTRAGIVGMAGDASACLAFAQHFDGVEVPDEHLKGAAALVLCAEGIVLYDESARGERVQEPFFAIGSGAPVALGAMHMGATAREAARAACRWNNDCGLPVVALRLTAAVRRARRSRRNVEQ